MEFINDWLISRNCTLLFSLWWYPDRFQVFNRLCIFRFLYFDLVTLRSLSFLLFNYWLFSLLFTLNWWWCFTKWFLNISEWLVFRCRNIDLITSLLQILKVINSWLISRDCTLQLSKWWFPIRFHVLNR